MDTIRCLGKKLDLIQFLQIKEFQLTTFFDIFYYFYYFISGPPGVPS